MSDECTCKVYSPDRPPEEAHVYDRGGWRVLTPDCPVHNPEEIMSDKPSEMTMSDTYRKPEPCQRHGIKGCVSCDEQVPTMKPCPFCGGRGRAIAAVYPGLTETWVECRFCFAQTDAIEGAYEEGAKARRAWNRRVPTDAKSMNDIWGDDFRSRRLEELNVQLDEAEVDMQRCEAALEVAREALSAVHTGDKDGMFTEGGDQEPEHRETLQNVASALKRIDEMMGEQTDE